MSSRKSTKKSSTQVQQAESLPATVARLNIDSPKEKSELNMSPCQPQATRTSKKQQELVSNHYPMAVSGGRIIYPYSFSVEVYSDDKIFHLSKGPRDDGSRILRVQACSSSLAIGLKKYGLLGDGEYMVSDGTSVALGNVNLSQKLKRYSNILQVDIEELSAELRKAILIPKPKGIRVHLASSEHPPFNTVEFTKILSSGAGLADKDSSILQFLEIITSDPMMKEYVAFGAGKFFPRNAAGKSHGRGDQMSVLGLWKGIGTITQQEKCFPAIIMDIKSGIFFKEQALVESVRLLLGRTRHENDPIEAEDWKLVDKYVRGLRLTFTHDGKVNSFIAAGISSQPSGVMPMEVFSNLFDLRSQYSHWPAVKVNRKADKKFVTEYFPMGICSVAKNQRVPLEKQGRPPAPIPVARRFEDINNHMAKIYFKGGKRVLEAFGLTIKEEPVDVSAIRRSLPQPVYAGGDKPTVDAKGSWRIGNSRLISPAHIDDIVVGYDCDKSTVDLMIDVLKEVAERHKIMANWHKMSVSHLKKPAEKIRHIFERVAAQKLEKACGEAVLVLYLDSKVDNPHSHDLLKYFERIVVVPTQQTTTEVAQNLRRNRDTAQNIVNKINIKMGGINYAVCPDEFMQNAWLDKGNTFVMGYDVSHPTGLPMDKRAPVVASTIGFSFNGAKDPQSFVGDFHYQLPREEKVNDEIMIDRVKWMLKRFTEHRPLPENIVILRDGVSTGQFAMVIKEEFVSIKKGVEEYKKAMGKKAINWNPKYLFVIVTKRHNKRFAIAGDRGMVNPLPGVVVDDTIVRSDVTHFIMQSHEILKGTGKLPNYYVHVNELRQNNFETQDKIQSFMLALAYDHQICHRGISIPEPVYQADAYATRGKNMWNTHMELGNEFPRLTSWDRDIYDTAPIDYEAMTKMLAYRGTPFENMRINA